MKNLLKTMFDEFSLLNDGKKAAGKLNMGTSKEYWSERYEKY